MQTIRQIVVSQIDGSCKKPLASRKSGKSSEGASSSRRPSPGSPLSPKATVSAPQAKIFHAAEGGGHLREAQPILDGFGRSFYVAASASRGQAIGAVSDIKLILCFILLHERCCFEFGSPPGDPKPQTTRR